ncbi:hypothetical protein BDC45DRAFT_603788 [Circinella umbellata]|nr:hypothetical protein BDC45DRAFT_603788 [Circinella umbellata]
MKVQTLLLGYFSDEKPVHVYQLTNQVLYKLSDISLLFGLPHLPQHPTLSTNLLSNNSPHCYRDDQDLYLSTKLLGEIAISLNKYQLAEFCKFKPNDYTAGLADSILDSMPRFERVKKMGQWKGMDLPGLASASSSSIDTITSSHNTKNSSKNNNNRIPFTTNINTTSYSPPTTLHTSQESTPPTLRRNEKRSASNNNNNNDEHDSNSNQRKSSPLVKTEPLSPPPSFVPASPTRDQNSNSDSTNPMALNSVLMNGDRRRSGSAADDQHQPQGSNKRQRVDNNNENGGSSSTTTSNSNKRQSYRSVLPKPMHTVGSQSSSNAPSTLLSKRLQSKQGKNTRHLTIFAPSYNNQPALGIRSAPLNTNFLQQQQQHQHQQPPGTSGNGLIQPPTLPSSHHQHPHHQLRHAHQPGVNHHPPLHTAGGNSNQHSSHHHHQQQQKGYYYGQGPSTSLPQSSQAPRMGMLHPGHTLAPLLSPRAPIPSQHREAASQRLSPRSNKQEFAIPPIVPSQQQPPLTAHPSSTAYYPYMASPMYQRNNNNTSGSNNNSGNNNNGSGSSGSGSSSNNNNSNQHHPPVTGALPTTAREVPLPPQTPTTNSFGSLQRQQFLQPFEHLFETIETSRTLKTTLDDQIRRSSTLMQTLQASSTTIEGLVRNQIKEAQKEMMAEMDATFENILQRIEKLERVEGKEHVREKQGQEDEEEEAEERRRVGIETPPPPVPTSATTLSSHKNKRRHDEEEQGEHDNNNGEPSSSRTTKSNGFLRSPPTIVRSQNDIGPNEYHGLLNALRERLDRLERQFDN